ncbi:MAG: penicillin-binding protein 2 [Myxococcota bacterium]
MRVGWVALMMAVVFAVFIVRLFQLQILEGADLASRSQRNSVRALRLEAPRGDIVDREGRVLATNRPAFRLQVIPNELRSLDLTYSVLADLLERNADDLAERVGKPRGRKRFQPVVLVGDLSYEQRARIETHRYALPGVVTDLTPHRLYVEADRASHVLGSIGQIGSRELASLDFVGYRAGEVIGKDGMESSLESHLRGTPGGRNVVVDVSGQEVEIIDEVDPVPGGRLVLTLDLDLQRVAEQVFRSEDPDQPDPMGALVAMDPRTGEVLALVSRPTYDPNDFSGGIDKAAWNALISHEWRPLRNRAISDQYPPGSTYKPIVAIAGLSEGLLDPHEKVHCPGYYRLGRRVYRCWKHEGHGDVDLEAALRGSCDVYFYKLGLELGIDVIAEYADRFGLGKTTGIELPGERPGLVPTQAWKQRARGESWIRGETVSASIGQGHDLVTPLQLAQAYSILANGGVVHRPHLIKRLETWDGLTVENPVAEADRVSGLDPEVLALVRRALVSAVEHPDATGVRAQVEGVRVGGKTATSQVVSLDLVKGLEPEEIPVAFRDHALFAAFAPADAPEIVVVVVVEHAGAGGGKVAAPMAQKVLARYFEKNPASGAARGAPDASGGSH